MKSSFQCPQCKGIGVDFHNLSPFGAYRCRHCGGTGRVEYRPSHYIGIALALLFLALFTVWIIGSLYQAWQTFH